MGGGRCGPPGSRAGARSAAAPSAPARKAGDGQGPAPAVPSKNRLRDQRRLERAIEDAEAALARLEDELADPSHWANQYDAAKATARHTAAKRAVEEAYAALEAFEDKAPAGA
jgi:ATP-binding cassette, subfamily F, member 3